MQNKFGKTKKQLYFYTLKFYTMGLDMYLTKKTYVKNWEHNRPEEKFTITIKKGGKKFNDIQTKRVSYIIEEAMYWRKFNALHAWFVKECQDGNDDCKDYYVDDEKLIELLGILKQIDKDHSKADELLPTADGFFFGNTNYDEWYYNDVKNTIKMLEDEMDENGNFYGSYYYRSSW